MAAAVASPTKDTQAIVIDAGSENCKSGFAGDDAPRSVMRTVVGRPRVKGLVFGSVNKDVYVGQEALQRRGILTLRTPIEHGAVNDWADMEKIWNAIFMDELRVSPEEHSVLLSEAPNPRKAEREKTTQVMFENFRVPAFFLSSSAVLSMYASGRTTGLVIECGADCTWISPVFEGFALPPGSCHMSVGGSNLTEYLGTILTERGYSFTTTAERELLRDIKEKLCYVPLDFEEEMSKCASDSSMEKAYELPDGQLLTLSNERCRVGEPMFRPGLLGFSQHGLDQSIFNWMKRIDKDLHAQMYNNIVLAGGNSLLPGLPERLHKCLASLLKKDAPLRIIAPPERKYSAWIGGSIMASLASFNSFWITKQEYDDAGPSMVSRKCF